MAELTITRDFDASREQLWSAWTDDAELLAWFWPPRLQASGQVDARLGGSWRIASEVADMAVGGTFTAVTEPRLLDFSWRWDGDGSETRVVVSIDATDTGCRLMLTHDGFGTDEDRDQHTQGWNDCLDRLAVRFE